MAWQNTILAARFKRQLRRWRINDKLCLDRRQRKDRPMTFLLVLIAIAVAVIFYAVMLYNRLVGLRNQVANAWKQIDVQLKRRYDLIPNLVETVKDYMAYEQETLRQVIEARNGAMKANTGQPSAASVAAEGALSGAIGKLFALAENYPDLKANASVTQLMEELTGTENKIAFARQFYNDSAMSMNNAVESFPSNFVASRYGFQKAGYFEVPEAEKATIQQPVKVDLR
jgi:LemA protein